MKLTVIGCGRWGSFIAWYLDKIGHNVTLYGRATSKDTATLISTKTNGLVTFDESVKITTDINEASNADVIIISINAQGLRSLMGELSALNIKNKTLVLCMKGIESETGKRLTEVVSENTDSSNNVAVWIGPGHVQDFVSGIPNCMVIDSNIPETKKMLVEEFSSELIRFYYGGDLIGNEVGAAAKNVIGIAAGMLDGLNLSALKGALMSRGTREISRLIKAMGGNELSAYGLCHLGDYEATLFSKCSHNRMFGEMFIKKEKFDRLAEGYYTVVGLMKLCEIYNCELPICETVYNILYNNALPEDELNKLFTRKIAREFK